MPSIQKPGVVAGRAWAVAMGGYAAHCPSIGQGRLEWVKGLGHVHRRVDSWLCDRGQVLNLSEHQFLHLSNGRVIAHNTVGRLQTSDNAGKATEHTGVLKLLNIS